MIHTRFAAAWLGALCFFAVRCGAATFTAIDQGWYNSSGTHQPANLNYFTGFQNSFTTPVEFRNFFVFDLAGLTEPQTAVTLRAFIYQNGFNDDRTDLGLTWSIYGVNMSVPQLVSGTGGVTAFDDLGTGDILGSALVVKDTNSYCCDISQFGRYVEVTLNEDGVGYLNGQLGSTVVFGGRIDRVNGADNWLFSNSEIALSVHPPMLVTSVPVPAAAWLLASALGSLAWGRFRGTGMRKRA